LLGGLKVLVVEDEPTIALYLRDIIETAEGEVVGSCASLKEWRDLVRRGSEIDAAVLDVNLADGEVTPILEALRSRDVPTVVYTGGAGLPSSVRERHRDVHVLQKPVHPGRLLGELRRVSRGSR
jgi:DNA-binding NtrC family response regulator